MSIALSGNLGDCKHSQKNVELMGSLHTAENAVEEPSVFIHTLLLARKNRTCLHRWNDFC